MLSAGGYFQFIFLRHTTHKKQSLEDCLPVPSNLELNGANRIVKKKRKQEKKNKTDMK